MNLFRWTAVAGILIVAGACSDSTAPSSSARFGDIRLSVSSSSREVVRGSPLTFHVELVNESSSAVTLHFGDSCQIIPTIQNGLGQVVLPPGGTWGCLTMLTELALVPGQPVVVEFVWTGANSFLPGAPPSLPAGSYFFTAEVPANEATLRVTIGVTLK
jgi:hypothetical protein